MNTDWLLLLYRKCQRQRWVILSVLWFAAACILFVTPLSGVEDATFFGLWRARHIAAAILLIAISIPILVSSWSHRYAKYCLVLYWQLGFAILMLEFVGLVGFLNYSILLGNDPLPTNSLGSQAEPYIDVVGETSQDIATFRGIDHPSIPFRYKTDRRGFRNPFDPDSAEIYFVGDSIVVGATVAYESTMAGLLRASTNYEVLNIALIATGIQEQHQVFLQSELPLNNRLILQFVFEGNDLADSKVFRTALVTTDDIPNSNLLNRIKNRSLVGNTITRAQRAIASPSAEPTESSGCNIGGQQFEFLWLSNSFSGLEDEQYVITAKLESLAREVALAGGTFGVIFIPAKFRVLGDLCTWRGPRRLSIKENVGPFRETMLEWSISSGIPMLDMTNALVIEAIDGRIPWYWGDTHLNEVGHAVVARNILDWSAYKDWDDTQGRLGQGL